MSVPPNLRSAYLPLSNGDSLALKVRRWNSQTFIECEQPARLLTVLGHQQQIPLSNLLRGVFIPGQGAFFQLFDHFGTILHDQICLEESIVSERLISQMIWEVRDH